RVVAGNKMAIVLYHEPFLREVERYHMDFLLDDVLPDVALGPVGQRKHAHRFAFVNSAAVERPELWTLTPWIPLTECVPQGKHAFFGARSFFLAAGAPDCRIELIFVQGVEECSRFQLAAAPRDTELQRMSAGCDRVFVTMHDESRADFFAEPIAKFDHLFELVTRVDVKERERQRSWIERFPRKVYEHARILSDGIQKYRISKLCDGFAQNINGFAFKLAKMCPLVIHDLSCVLM